MLTTPALSRRIVNKNIQTLDSIVIGSTTSPDYYGALSFAIYSFVHSFILPSFPESTARMGNSSSVQKGKDDVDKFDGIETLGYRVLGVQPNSPAAKAGLVSFLDFLVGADRKMLLGSGENLQEGEEYDDVDLPAMLQDHLNKPLELCKSVESNEFVVWMEPTFGVAWINIG